MSSSNNNHNGNGHGNGNGNGPPAPARTPATISAAVAAQNPSIMQALDLMELTRTTAVWNRDQTITDLQFSVSIGQLDMGTAEVLIMAARAECAAKLADCARQEAALRSVLMGN